MTQDMRTDVGAVIEKVMADQQVSTGSFAVQYNSPTGGYSSAWPEWACKLAKDALLGNRRVWVASDGDPFGSNLVFVMIFP